MTNGEWTSSIFDPTWGCRRLAHHSFRRLDGLEPDIVCFGHGHALSQDAIDAFHTAVSASTVPDRFRHPHG